jgi:hypothetical protein
VPPTSIAALLILIAAVLPGAAYTWAFERQASGYGVTLADRVLRFIATSVLFHLVFGWPEYFLYRIAFSSHHLAAGQFAAARSRGAYTRRVLLVMAGSESAATCHLRQRSAC